MTGELTRFLPALIAALGGFAPLAGDLVTRAGTPAKETDSDDPLYIEAAAIVIANKRASISLVQRHLRIGYNRTARLIEDMERAGIVSAMDSSGARTVLVTADAMTAAGKDTEGATA